MIKIFKSLGGYFELPKAVKNSWINVTNPKPSEIQKLTDKYDLPGDLITDILDIDERSRFEFEENWTYHGKDEFDLVADKNVVADTGEQAIEKARKLYLKDGKPFKDEEDSTITHRLVALRLVKVERGEWIDG